MTDESDHIDSAESESNRKVVRFLVQFDDGNVRYLEGEEATNYISQVDSMLGFIQLTRKYMVPAGFDDVAWKEIPVSEVGRIFEQPIPTQEDNQ